MRLLSWLRTTPARPPRPGPRLEALGDRTVPAALRVNHDFNVHVAADASNQHGTLDWAVANAKSGDTILLTADAARTGITLARGELILTPQNLTITTEAGAPPVTISGNDLSRVFEVASGANVTLSNLTITGGNGLADNPAGDGSRDQSGGGILVDSGGTLVVSGCTVSGNSAYYSGGGISNTGTTTVIGTTLSGNTGPIWGGGISNYYGGTLTVIGSTLSDNSATQSGGGIYGLYGGTVTVIASSLSRNSAVYGGGIDNFGGTATVTNSNLSADSAVYGGGIDQEGGKLAVSGCNLSGNSAYYSGGGIYSGGNLTVIDHSTLTGNSASSGGGVYDIGALTLSDSTLSGNSANYGGGICIDNGGIFHGFGTVMISGSTLSNNTAAYGGGIYNLAGTVTVSGCTLSGNSASQAGGGFYNATSFFGSRTYPGTVTVGDSTNISGNTAPVGFGADVYNVNQGVLYLDGTSTIGILDGAAAIPI